MKLNKQPTQCARVLKYMEDFGEITSAEAISDLGCYRLGARIWELKAQGYRIKRRMVKGRNRYGEPISYAAYFLEEAK